MNKNTEQHWRALVLLLKNIAKEKGITSYQIAEKTGIKQPNVSRFFSLNNCPSLANFLEIARAVGVNFFFEDKDSKVELNVLFNKAMDELGRN